MRSCVERLFHEVADLSGEARGRYFAENGIDTQTRKEVEALVVFDSHSSTVLEKNISEVAQRALSQLEP